MRREVEGLPELELELEGGLEQELELEELHLLLRNRWVWVFDDSFDLRKRIEEKERVRE